MDRLNGIEEGCYVQVKDYLEALPNANVRAATNELLGAAANSIELHIAGNRISDGPPELRIRNDDSPNAEGIRGIIRINHGLIQHCLHARTDQITSSFKHELPLAIYMLIDPTAARKLMFSWIVLHEFVHGINRHSDAGLELGNDPTTQQALEYDADLCATAAVYRVAQHLLRQAVHNDIVIRQFVLSCIFWVLRTLTSFCERSTHSRLELRYFQVISKLTQLDEIPGSRFPDVDFEDHAAQVRLPQLIDSLALAERAFQTLPEFQLERHGNILERTLKAIETGEHLIIPTRWEEIRLRVAELHGRRELEIERELHRRKDASRNK